MVFIENNVCDFRVSIYNCQNSNFYKSIYITNIILDIICIFFGILNLKLNNFLNKNLYKNGKATIIFHFVLYYFLESIRSILILNDIYSKSYGSYLLEYIRYTSYLSCYIGMFFYKYSFIKVLIETTPELYIDESKFFGKIRKKFCLNIIHIKYTFLFFYIINQIILFILTYLIAQFRTYPYLKLLFFYHGIESLITSLLSFFVTYNFLHLIMDLINRNKESNIESKDLEEKLKNIKTELISTCASILIYSFIYFFMAFDISIFSNIYASGVFSFIYVLFIQITNLPHWIDQFISFFTKKKKKETELSIN